MFPPNHRERENPSTEGNHTQFRTSTSSIALHDICDVDCKTQNIRFHSPSTSFSITSTSTSTLLSKSPSSYSSSSPPPPMITMNASSSSIILSSIEKKQSEDDGDDEKELSVDELRIRLAEKRENMSKASLAILEIERRKKLQKCRYFYLELCSELQMAPPKESFNRWLLEQSNIAHSQNRFPDIDVFIPPPILKGADSQKKFSIYNEISEDFPIKVNMWPHTGPDAINSLRSYYQGGIELFERERLRSNENPNLKSLLTLLESEFSEIETFLRDANPAHSFVADVLAYLKETKRRCSNMFTALMHDRVESLCQRLAIFCDDQYQLLQNLEPTGENVPVSICAYRTTPMIFTIQLIVSDSEFLYSLNATHFEKLRHLYFSVALQLEHQRPVTEESFLFSLFILLYRYETIFGGDGQSTFEGGGQQSAVPPRAFRSLFTNFGVEMELYASPLNCFFPQFCSLFPDIDCLFGSCGKSFDLLPSRGSFEANPPFAESTMEIMRLNIELCLSSSSQPLSFIIVLPLWTDCITIQMLADSRWLRSKLILNARSHSYVNGLQHRNQSFKRSFAAVHDTIVYFLQNDAGFSLWPPTPEKLSLLQAAFAHSER